LTEKFELKCNHHNDIYL